MPAFFAAVWRSEAAEFRRVPQGYLVPPSFRSLMSFINNHTYNCTSNSRFGFMMYQTRQAYAPTPHSYIPNTALSATINLDEVLVFVLRRESS
jgi:hypothetical protein